MIKGLSGATIWSEDLNRLLPFYRDVLGLPVRINSPQFVVFGAAEGPALGLGTHSEVRGSATDPARHMVGLATDDIQADWKRLQGAGVKFIEAPKNYGNLWIATLTDPDGNLIQLFQPIQTSGGRAESLAKQIEAKAKDAVATLDRLSDADWKKVTEAEKWTVAATAHHLAGALDRVPMLLTGLVSGQLPGGFTRTMLDGMNAQHAKEFASCSKAETRELLEKGAVKAAATVRGLSDEQLAKRGTVFTDAPPMSAEDLVMGALVIHIDEHFGSIRKTVGH
jgi:predicted enzyme related to lactoylglutathione lyase